MLAKSSFRILLGAGVAMAIALAALLSFTPKEHPAAIHEVVANIETYQEEHGKLPDPTDLNLLSKLKISHNGDGALSYMTIDSENYVLIKLENGDGPVWYYDSRVNAWAYGKPNLTKH